jgi:hypothetical protein
MVLIRSSAWILATVALVLSGCYDFSDEHACEVRQDICSAEVLVIAPQRIWRNSTATLSVFGNSLEPDAVIEINGQPRDTTWISKNEISTPILSLGMPMGLHTVEVKSPSEGDFPVPTELELLPNITIEEVEYFSNGINGGWIMLTGSNLEQIASLRLMGATQRFKIPVRTDYAECLRPPGTPAADGSQEFILPPVAFTGTYPLHIGLADKKSEPTGYNVVIP